RTDELGSWSDVYSLGKLLYWLIAGKIFDREKHRDEKYDLTKSQKDAAIFFIYELLDKMILFETRSRLQHANIIAEEVEKIIRRFLMSAHPIDINSPHECTYSGIGQYNFTLYHRGNEEVSYLLGINGSGDPSWLILICDHCGNVQIFRPDLTNDKDVWGKI